MAVACPQPTPGLRPGHPRIVPGGQPHWGSVDLLPDRVERVPRVPQDLSSRAADRRRARSAWHSVTPRSNRPGNRPTQARTAPTTPFSGRSGHPLIHPTDDEPDPRDPQALIGPFDHPVIGPLADPASVSSWVRPHWSGSSRTPRSWLSATPTSSRPAARTRFGRSRMADEHPDRPGLLSHATTGDVYRWDQIPTVSFVDFEVAQSYGAFVPSRPKSSSSRTTSSSSGVDTSISSQRSIAS